VDVIADAISRKCKHFTYRFYTNMYRKFLNNFIFIYKTIIQYISTVDTYTFIRLFVHCTFLLAMATPVRKTFTTDVALNAAVGIK